jgi:hypothetical protein
MERTKTSTFQQDAWDALGLSRCNDLLASSMPRRIGGVVQVEVLEGIAFKLAECLDSESRALKGDVDSAAASGVSNPSLAKRYAGIIQAWKDVQAAIGRATQR